MAIVNTQTIISCGLSIDIYPSFDPVQIIICPYVLIRKSKLQSINMNISIDNNNQIIIESKPSLISPPKYFMKRNNNSFISPPYFNKNSTYYLSFSSELTCRYSFLNNETICFYYPVSSNFIQIENHYDEIQHGSLMLSKKSRYGYYIVFIVIAILIIIICFVFISMLYTNEFPLQHTARLEDIIDAYVAKQEAARRPPEPKDDGGAEQGNREAHTHVADA